MSKSLEELKDLFSNFDGNLQAEFIEQFPEIWDDCYDIMMGSRYHRVMTSCMLAGWFAAIKAVSDSEKKLMEEIEKVKSENISLKIDYQALENSNRKLNEANERIVEFDSIKNSHLATIKKLKEEVDNLSEQECMNCGAWLVQSNVLEKYSNKMIDELKAEITKLKKSRDGLRKALYIVLIGESILHDGITARDALKTDDELMEKK